MQINHAYTDHAVLQRNAMDLCSVSVPYFNAEPDSTVRAFHKDGRAAGSETRTDSRGKGFLSLDLLKAGGPYEIHIYENGNKVESITDLAVGDVWLLAGQSNMVGCGKLTEAEAPSPMVRCFGFQNSWRVAEGRLHNLKEYVQKAYKRIVDIDNAAPREQDNSSALGVGPGHSFALKLAEISGVPQGVIVGAVGAACLDQWDPDKRDGEEDDAYYGALLKRFLLASCGARGLFWYQGEADTRPERYEAYTEKTVRLLNAFRRDFASGEFPIVVVQLASQISTPRDLSWTSVREQQRQLQSVLTQVGVVPAMDLDIMDGLHLTAESAKEVGRRAAIVMAGLMKHDESVFYPEPVEIRSGWDPQIKAPTIEVTFRNLHGPLKAPGRPQGFLVHDIKDGTSRNAISYTELCQDKAILHLSRGEYGSEPAEKYRLSFGGLCNPAVNITDGEGRPIPGFGPLPIRKG